MVTQNSTLTLIDDLVAEAKLDQTRTKEKANTVTTAIGGALTVALTAATAWLESGTNIPSWLPIVVMVLGTLMTTYGVSKTKNGITDSVADKLHNELARKIDLSHNCEMESAKVYAEHGHGADDRDHTGHAHTLRSIADEIVDGEVDR